MHASFSREFCLKHLCVPRKAESKVACQYKASFGGYCCKNLKENRWNFRWRQRVEINWAKPALKVGGSKQSIVELGCSSTVLVTPQSCWSCMSLPLSLGYLWCTTVLHRSFVIVVSPTGCDKAYQEKKESGALRLGDVCLKASSLQRNLRQVAALRVIDICNVSGKDVFLRKIQLDQSSCFIWTQES